MLNRSALKSISCLPIDLTAVTQKGQKFFLSKEQFTNDDMIELEEALTDVESAISEIRNGIKEQLRICRSDD